MFNRLLVASVACTVALAACGREAGKSVAKQATAVGESDGYRSVDQTDKDAFGRLASTFVASQQHSRGGRTYFTQPKPFGSWLCRVDVVRLPGWIATQTPKEARDSWQSDIEIETMYAAWRSPQDRWNGDRDQACRDFRQFDNLILADGIDSPGRYVFLLDQLLTDVSRDKTSYEVACLDRRLDEVGLECKPEEVLQGLSIFMSFTGRTTGSLEIEGGRIWSDTLYFEFGEPVYGHPPVLEVNFESKQTYGKQSADEADIQSVQMVVIVL